MNQVKVYWKADRKSPWKIQAIHNFHKSPLDFIDALYEHLKIKVEGTFEEYKIVRPQQRWWIAAYYPPKEK